MKASTERLVIRWLHIVASIPILGFIYGPVAQIPRAAAAVRWVLMPAVVLSGLWLWKGHLVRNWWRQRTRADSRGPRHVRGETTEKSHSRQPMLATQRPRRWSEPGANG